MLYPMPAASRSVSASVFLGILTLFSSTGAVLWTWKAGECRWEYYGCIRKEEAQWRMAVANNQTINSPESCMKVCQLYLAYTLRSGPNIYAGYTPNPVPGDVQCRCDWSFFDHGKTDAGLPAKLPSRHCGMPAWRRTPSGGVDSFAAFRCSNTGKGEDDWFAAKMPDSNTGIVYSPYVKGGAGPDPYDFGPDSPSAVQEQSDDNSKCTSDSCKPGSSNRFNQELQRRFQRIEELLRKLKWNY